MTAAESAPGTLVARMGIEIVEEDPRRLVARMPLTGNRQMYGFLHGGASAAFAQALATHAAALEAGPCGRVTGQELSCTHHRAARGEGWVEGVCTPLYLGDAFGTYDVAVHDRRGNRIASARLTCRLRRAAGPSARPAPTGESALFREPALSEESA
ncbi:PaaI family thioesterase [Streptomyces griseoaurantiacus]|uniref:PaaI family thioesterase n=1 Tax=Streptomyces griseoaurantiacus TaxID=68213 RepID=UPI00346064FB